MTTAIATAAELMRVDVVTLSPRDSLQDAMQTMTEHHISGVPVVDEDNHCIGVISTSDVIAYVEDDHENLEATPTRAEYWFNPENQKWEETMFSPQMLGEYDAVPIEDAMTRDPITVPTTMPVSQVARKMTQNGIHRVFVVDARSGLRGVISAFDFVRLAADTT